MREAVQIEMNAGEYSLNSKLEYSRSNIPKMNMKLGNKEEEECPFKKREKDTKELIRMTYKKENKRIKDDDKKEMKVEKRRKMEKESRNEILEEIPDENSVESQVNVCKIVTQTVKIVTQMTENNGVTFGVNRGNNGGGIIDDTNHEKATDSKDSNGEKGHKIIVNMIKGIKYP